MAQKSVKYLEKFKSETYLGKTIKFQKFLSTETKKEFVGAYVNGDLWGVGKTKAAASKAAKKEIKKIAVSWGDIK